MYPQDSTSAHLIQKSLILRRRISKNKKKQRNFHTIKMWHRRLPYSYEEFLPIQENNRCNGCHPQKHALPQHGGHQELYTQCCLIPIGGNPEGIMI